MPSAYMVYLEHGDTIEEDFDTGEQAALFIALFRYGNYGEVADFKDRAMKLLFRRMLVQFDKGTESWEAQTMSGLYGLYKREANKRKEEVLEFEEWADRELTNFESLYDPIGDPFEE